MMIEEARRRKRQANVLSDERGTDRTFNDAIHIHQSRLNSKKRPSISYWCDTDLFWEFDFIHTKPVSIAHHFDEQERDTNHRVSGSESLCFVTLVSHRYLFLPLPLSFHALLPY